MDHRQTVKQILDFNKSTFDSVFNTVSTLQDETESFISRFMEKSNLITPDGKKIIGRMSDAYRKGRSDLRSIADEGYKKAYEYFAPADKKQS